MTPYQLYQMFQEELLDEGVASDNWDDLDIKTRLAWGKLCRRLRREYGLK